MSGRSFCEQLDQLLERGNQTLVAEDVGVSPQTISDWKHGRRRPKPHHVQALEAALDVEPGNLSRHLGYVSLATEEAGRYESDLLVDATRGAGAPCGGRARPGHRRTRRRRRHLRS